MSRNVIGTASTCSAISPCGLSVTNSTMKKTMDRYRVGEMRPSQLMFSFGVGASVDLPHLTVMIMGLEDWPLHYMNGLEITEDRLLLAVKQPAIMGSHVTRLIAPPPRPDDTAAADGGSEPGVPVATFPRWMRCPKCELLGRVDSGQFDLKTDAFRPDKARYVHTHCNVHKYSAPAVLPSRFVLACENGHLDDFPWIAFVHGGQPCPQPRLKMTENGAGGDASSVLVICDNCDAKKPMSQAFEKDFGEPGAKLVSSAGVADESRICASSLPTVKPKSKPCFWAPVTRGFRLRFRPYRFPRKSTDWDN